MHIQTYFWTPHLDMVPLPRNTNGNPSLPSGDTAERSDVPRLTSVKLPQSGATMLKALGASCKTHTIANLQQKGQTSGWGEDRFHVVTAECIKHLRY